MRVDCSTHQLAFFFLRGQCSIFLSEASAAMSDSWVLPLGYNNNSIHGLTDISSSLEVNYCSFQFSTVLGSSISHFSSVSAYRAFFRSSREYQEHLVPIWHWQKPKTTCCAWHRHGEATQNRFPDWFFVFTFRRFVFLFFFFGYTTNVVWDFTSDESSIPWFHFVFLILRITFFSGNWLILYKNSHVRASIANELPHEHIFTSAL